MATLNPNLNLSQLPAEAAGGLRQPRVDCLQTGEILFRFASTERSKDLWASGPWWVREQDYRKIVRAHEQSDWSLGLTGRSALAVKQGWNQMDVVVKALVMQDINVFCGLGRTQYRELLPNGWYLTLRGWPDIEQVYIPNIGGPHGRTLVGYQALKVLRQKRVSSLQLA
jgi:hypothetical protein